MLLDILSRAFSSILNQWCHPGELIALCKASIARARLLALFAHAQDAKLSLTHTRTQCIKAFKVLRVELCHCSHTVCWCLQYTPESHKLDDLILSMLPSRDIGNFRVCFGPEDSVVTPPYTAAGNLKVQDIKWYYNIDDYYRSSKGYSHAMLQ